MRFVLIYGKDTERVGLLHLVAWAHSDYVLWRMLKLTVGADARIMSRSININLLTRQCLERVMWTSHKRHMVVEKEVFFDLKRHEHLVIFRIGFLGRVDPLTEFAFALERTRMAQARVQIQVRAIVRRGGLFSILVNLEARVRQDHGL